MSERLVGWLGLGRISTARWGMMSGWCLGGSSFWEAGLTWITWAKDAATSMRICGPIAVRLHALPDGAHLRLRVD